MSFVSSLSSFTGPEARSNALFMDSAIDRDIWTFFFFFFVQVAQILHATHLHFFPFSQTTCGILFLTNDMRHTSIFSRSHKRRQRGKAIGKSVCERENMEVCRMSCVRKKKRNGGVPHVVCEKEKKKLEVCRMSFVSSLSSFTGPEARSNALFMDSAIDRDMDTQSQVPKRVRTLCLWTMQSTETYGLLLLFLLLLLLLLDPFMLQCWLPPFTFWFLLWISSLDFSFGFLFLALLWISPLYVDSYVVCNGPGATLSATGPVGACGGYRLLQTTLFVTARQLRYV